MEISSIPQTLMSHFHPRFSCTTARAPSWKGLSRGANACERRNLATVNTGFDWTVHGASQVLPLGQAPGRTGTLPPTHGWALKLEVGRSAESSSGGAAAACFISGWLEIPGNVIYMKSQSNHSARNPSSRSEACWGGAGATEKFQKVDALKTNRRLWR